MKDTKFLRLNNENSKDGLELVNQTKPIRVQRLNSPQHEDKYVAKDFPTGKCCVMIS